jgi:hypothetical protein
MERHVLGIIGGALIVVGLVGMAIVGVWIATSPTSVDPTAVVPPMMRNPRAEGVRRRRTPPQRQAGASSEAVSATTAPSRARAVSA